MANLGIFIPPVILAIAGYFVIRYVKKNPPKYLKYIRLSEVANQLGFKHERKHLPSRGSFFGFKYFFTGSYLYQREPDIFTLQTRGMIFKIFDCNSERQTIIQAEKPEAKLPQFILCPNRFMNRIDQRRKLQKFSFDNDPDFSKMFILRGKGQKKINQTFSPEVRQYLKDLPLKFYLEGLNDKLIFYKPGKRLKPTDLQPFYHQFKELVPYFFRERGDG